MNNSNLSTKHDFHKYFIYSLTNLCEDSSSWLEYDYKLTQREDQITLRYDFTKSFTNLLSKTAHVKVFLHEPGETFIAYKKINNKYELTYKVNHTRFIYDEKLYLYGYLYFGLEFYKIYNRVTQNQLITDSWVKTIPIRSYNLKRLSVSPDTISLNKDMYQPENSEYKTIAELLYELHLSIEGFNTITNYHVRNNLIGLSIFTPHTGLNIYKDDTYILPVWHFKIMFI